MQSTISRSASGCDPLKIDSRFIGGRPTNVSCRLSSYPTAFGRLPERRRCRRYVVELDVRYRLSGSNGNRQAGSGSTVNLSATGVLFEAESPIAVGRSVELMIHWPAKLDDTCGLQLVARGTVVRCQGKLVAIEVHKYEFRTRKLPASPKPPANPFPFGSG